LGGYDSQDDNTKLTATFRDLNGVHLGSAVIGPVLAVDRSNLTGLLWRSAFGTLPRTAVKFQLVLEMTRVAGTYNDGYADNLSFEIAPHEFIGGGA
jgi:hypothetical protein